MKFTAAKAIMETANNVLEKMRSLTGGGGEHASLNRLTFGQLEKEFSLNELSAFVQVRLRKDLTYNSNPIQWWNFNQQEIGVWMHANTFQLLQMKIYHPVFGYTFPYIQRSC